VVELFLAMNSQEFIATRCNLGKTQKEMAELLGVSLRSIHAYEQGWRKIPATVERQIFLLVFLKANDNASKPCWELERCPDEKRERCTAWEFQAGTLCWFINGTICQGKVDQYWDDKLKSCRKCQVFKPVSEILENVILNDQVGPSFAGHSENNGTRSASESASLSVFDKSKDTIRKGLKRVFFKKT